METLKVYFRHGYIADYFRYLFGNKGAGVVNVSRRCKLGVFVLGLRRYSDLPLKQKQPKGMDYPTTIYTADLPETVDISASERRSPKKFVYYTCADLQEINEMTELYFDLDFWRYYIHASKLKVAQKDILESFILTRRLVSIEGDNEMLKKREYREELKNLKIHAKILKNKVDYINNGVKIEVEKYVNEKIYSTF